MPKYFPAFLEASSTLLLFSNEWTLTSIQAQYTAMGDVELFGSDSLVPAEVMVSYFSSAYSQRGMGSSVSASCSRHLTSPWSLVCISDTSHSLIPMTLSSEWPPLGPPSILTINGCSIWLFTPKFSIPSSQVPASLHPLAGLLRRALLTNNPQKHLKALCVLC